MSLANSSALKFDIDDRLDGDAKLYDGFADYAFTPSGDIWASTLSVERLLSKINVYLACLT